MDFPLPTDVPTLATHPPHGETDPDGPMGGAGASEPFDEAETTPATKPKRRGMRSAKATRRKQQAQAERRKATSMADQSTDP